MKKVINILLTIAMIMSMIPTVFAEESHVDWGIGTQVSYDGKGSEEYTITVPATLNPGKSGTVTLSGTWASNRLLNVTAQESVTLSNNLNANDTKVLDIVFDGIAQHGSNTESVSASKPISVESISEALFGVWAGKFYYNVEITTIVTTIPVQAVDKTGNNLNASSTVITGEEKTNLLNKLEESGIVDNKAKVDALIEVNSDEFDDLAETTFDVSSIANPGDKVIILHFDETTQEWEFISEETVSEDGSVTADFESYSPVGFIVVKPDGSMEVTLNLPLGRGVKYLLTNGEGQYYTADIYNNVYLHNPDGEIALTLPSACFTPTEDGFIISGAGEDYDGEFFITDDNYYIYVIEDDGDQYIVAYRDIAPCIHNLQHVWYGLFDENLNEVLLYDISDIREFNHLTLRCPSCMEIIPMRVFDDSDYVYLYNVYLEPQLYNGERISGCCVDMDFVDMNGWFAVPFDLAHTDNLYETIDGKPVTTTFYSEALTVPQTIKILLGIGWYSYWDAYNTDSEITYQGTMTMFEQIYDSTYGPYQQFIVEEMQYHVDSSWSPIKSFTIHCTDGDIVIGNVD